PVPHVRSSDIAINPHDGARTSGVGIAIDPAAAEVAIERGSTVPLRGGGRNCQIAGGDRASRGNGIGRAGTGYDSPGGNAGQSEAVVEGEERFPVHSFVCQSAAAPDYGGAFATNIPRKAKAWSEVL